MRLNFTPNTSTTGVFLFGGETLLKILNQNRQPVAVLENAFNIGYERVSNQIWSASFSMPLNDPKNEHCKALYFMELYDHDEYIGLFRINPKLTTKNDSGNTVKYECEHVLATLMDSVLFRYHQNDNLTTRANLEYLLSKQTIKHWTLGTVAFTRYFSYKWENENLLSALFSVPRPFDVQYRWTWNTQVYPWVLNLEEVDTAPTCEIREGKNLIGLEIEDNPMGVFNRIYPLGYGEGVNQLTIESVNGGVPYVEDAESVAKYGPRHTVWADRRFEDAASLKASAEALLKTWKEPIVSWKVSAADLSLITGVSIDKLKEGRVVRIYTHDYPVTDVRILKESKPDIKGDPGNVQLEIGNLLDDLGTTQTDLERRQQINELYSQGATNLIAYSYNDNADQNNPAEIRFYLPDEMVRINKLLLTYEIDNFRAYEQAIEGGGAIVKSTGAGGGTVKSTTSGGESSQTSSAGGNSTQSSSSGGGTTATSSADGSHRHQMFSYQGDTGSESPPGTFKNYLAAGDSGGQSQAAMFAPGWGSALYTKEASGNHNHSVTVPSHIHAVQIPAHTHQVQIPAHNHSIQLDNHVHEIQIPDHTHGIKFGIYKLDKMPSRVTIKVDGNTVPLTDLSAENYNLAPYLSKSDGMVTRGWHTIQIQPNDLGRINANVISQFFIQSRGGEAL